MKVLVRMFGGLAQRSGVTEETIDLPEGSTADDVLGNVADRYPSVAGLLERVAVAVNLEVASRQQTLFHDDEVALLPPVAGGEARILTGLRDQRISVDEALEAVAAPEAGGSVVFVGTVRSSSEEWGPVERLEYSAYREMAEPVLRRVAEEATVKWPLVGICILHAVGDLALGDQTVVVACSAPHRGEAFEACRYAIDELKVRVPVWKKEIGPGAERWVGLEEERPSDTT